MANMNTPQSSAETGNTKEYQDYRQFLLLQKAVGKCDWDAMENFLKLNPTAVNAKISSSGQTALHFAASYGHVKIVQELVNLMSEEDLEIQDIYGDLAIFLGAYSGITETVECMIRKNKKLACMANPRGLIPLEISCIAGHKNMTHYFYSVTPFELLLPENGTHGAQLLVSCILSRMFDLALDLIKRCPHLAFAKTQNGATPVFTLSITPAVFPSGNRLVFWQQWIYSCMQIQLPIASDIGFNINTPQKIQSEQRNIVAQVLAHLRALLSGLLKFSGIEQIYDLKVTHLQVHDLLNHICEEISTFDITQLMDGLLYRATFEAIKHGIVEFVMGTMKANTELIWTRDQTTTRTLFLLTVEHRQEKIFNLVYGLDGRRDSFVNCLDNQDNNMLHLAGLSTPSSQLARISGAALQMQRELQWFKEVESIVRPAFKYDFNKDFETPRQVFTRNHKDLLKEGERWMKETATSCTVVGALIITVMFAAVFTVPGGSNQDTGLPNFLHKKPFTIFIISDAISLFASSTSVLMFLGVLTSRYAEDDFLISLPTKLIIGLSTLFFSIAAMMVTFCAALLIMLDGELRVVIPIMLLASVPITLFISMQFPLLVEIFLSTYGSGNFDRKPKRWL